MERTDVTQARRGRSGGVLLGSLQIGLAVGLALVGCMTAFGGGFVIGMWYKATEQISPYASLLGQGTEPPVQQTADAPSGQEASQTFSFYSTLTRDQSATTAPGNVKKRDQAPEPPKGKTPEEPPKPALVAEAVKKPAPAEPPKPPVAVVSPKPVAEPPRVVQAPPAPVESKPPAAAVPAKPVAEPPRIVQTPPPPPSPPPQRVVTAVPETPAAFTAAAAPPPARPNRGDFTIQVGSFRSQEHAERLIQSLTQKGYQAYVRSVTTPGAGAWYRVRIGSFQDRTIADQTVQRLRAQEQVPAVVVSNY